MFTLLLRAAAERIGRQLQQTTLNISVMPQSPDARMLPHSGTPSCRLAAARLRQTARRDGPAEGSSSNRSHSELRQEVPRRKKPDNTDDDEDEAECGGLPGTMPDETKERIREENESRDWGQQNQRQEVIGVAVGHGTPVEQRAGR